MCHIALVTFASSKFQFQNFFVKLDDISFVTFSSFKGFLDFNDSMSFLQAGKKSLKRKDEDVDFISFYFNYMLQQHIVFFYYGGSQAEACPKSHEQVSHTGTTTVWLQPYFDHSSAS